MASIVKLGPGKQPPRAIDFFDHRSKRQRLRIGKVTHDVAHEFKRRVEKLVNAKRLNQSLDPETVHWLTGLCLEIKIKIAQFDLCELPEAEPAVPTLAVLLDDYLEWKRYELKPSSIKRLEHTFEAMKQFFKGRTLIDQITTTKAKDWRTEMLKAGLSEASIRTNARNAKSVFRDAVERKHIAENPFFALASSSIAAERSRFVTEAETDKILASCPDDNWKCLVGLARFAGLRVPSESHAVTWQDIDWNLKRLRVFAPKTSTTRVVPIFPKLAKLLDEAARKVTDHSQPIVALSGHNRHRQMTKIIDAAGLEPWPDLFQTLRRSCETQMAMTVPQHAVSAWIGHSELVSARHYLQVTDELFQRITGNTEGTTHGLRAAESAAESAAVKPGTESQDGESDSAGERAAEDEATKKPGHCRVFPMVASNCEVVRAGIEPATHGFSVHCSTN